MPFASRFPATVWIWRHLTSRIALRIYVSIVLLLFVTSVAIRTYFYIQTQRFQAVLAGLENVRIDQTTEEELLRLVPSLTRGDRDFPDGKSIRRYYFFAFSNEEIWLNFNSFVNDYFALGLRHTIVEFADFLGFRFLNTYASVSVIDGKVSEIQYGISKELGYPRPLFNIFSVKSFHGFWASYRPGFRVSSAYDENLQFLIDRNDERLTVAFAFDAPPQLISRAFKVNLGCFWSLRGCSHPRQISPTLWKEKDQIEAAAVERLNSADPCPDRILSARVRYLLNLDLLLLEVKKMRREKINEDGHYTSEDYSDYRVLEVLRGASRMKWDSVRTRDWMPSPTNPKERVGRPQLRWNEPGTRVLLFANHWFDSCADVPAIRPLCRLFGIPCLPPNDWKIRRSAPCSSLFSPSD